MLQTKNSSDLLLLAGLGGGTLLLESVAETPADDLEVADAAGAGGLPPLGLDGPVVSAGAGGGVSAHGAALLLDVEGDAVAADAQRVRLVAPLTKRAGSLSLEKARNTSCKWGRQPQESSRGGMRHRRVGWWRGA